MKKRISIFLVIFLVLTMGISSMAFSDIVIDVGAPAEIWVDDGYTDGNCDGHSWGVDAFASIPEAVAAAGDGSTVYVGPGNYAVTSTIVLDESITIAGPQSLVDPRPGSGSSRVPGSANEAVVDGGGHVGIIFEIDADNVEINGLEVKNGTGDLIYAPVGSCQQNPIIKYCLIHQATGDEGIQLKNSNGAVLEYNYVYDTAGDGLNISDNSTNGIIRYNELTNIRSENGGIYVYGSENTTIENNLVYNVSNNDGIKIGSKNGADSAKGGGSILNNVIHDTAQDGISIYTSNTLVEGNEVYNSHSENGAVYVGYSVTGISIKNNSIHDNTLSTGKYANVAGILLRSVVNAANVTVEGNKIYNNNPYGVTNLGTGTLNAVKNWWGDASGPSGAGSGSGDAVSSNVSFDPWYKNDGKTLLNRPVHNADTDKYYFKIQDAINDVATLNGQTIEVAPGRFEERFTINKSLNLLGAQAGVEPVEGGRTGGESLIVDTTGMSGSLVVITADNVVFDGFELEGGYGSVSCNIARATHENVQIEYNYIHSNKAWTGVCLMETGASGGTTTFNDYTIAHNYVKVDTTNPAALKTYPVAAIDFTGGGSSMAVYNRLRVTDNTVINPEMYGIFCGANPNNFEINEAVIENNTLSNCAKGINVYNLIDVEFNHNIFDNCGAFGAEINVRQGNVTGNIFRNSFPSGSDGSASYGLLLWGNKYGPVGSHDAVISGNEFYYNNSSNAAQPEYGIGILTGCDPETITINDNKFIDGGALADVLAVNNLVADKVADASKNWWGSSDGPVLSQISDLVNVFPYYTDAAMSKLIINPLKLSWVTNPADLSPYTTDQTVIASIKTDPVPYQKNIRFIVEISKESGGNYAAAVKGDFTVQSITGQDANTFYDTFAVRDGKLMGYWDHATLNQSTATEIVFKFSNKSKYKINIYAVEGVG